MIHTRYIPLQKIVAGILVSSLCIYEIDVITIKCLVGPLQDSKFVDNSSIWRDIISYLVLFVC